MSVRKFSVEGTDRLAARRKRARTRLSYAMLVLLVILLGAGIYGIHRDSVRVNEVKIFGGDQALAREAERAMEGSYLGIIPRNSIFFIPRHAIRNHILEAHLDIAAVSLFREGFNGLSIKVIERVPIARWCGAPLASSSAGTLLSEVNLNADCFLFDDNGLLYATATQAFMGASSTPNGKLVTPYVLFSALKDGAEIPAKATLANVNDIPSVLDFARQAHTLGAHVATIVIRDDEVDHFLTTGARITYVLGQENAAFDALTSAASNLNFAEVSYLDLRFPGKVYVKKMGEE